MTKSMMDLRALVEKSGDADLLRVRSDNLDGSGATNKGCSHDAAPFAR